MHISQVLAQVHNALPARLPLLGTLIALLLGLTARFAFTSRRRMVEIEAINRRLADQIAEREQAQVALAE
jgi:hypothetical protein